MNWMLFQCYYYRRRLTLLAAGSLSGAEKDQVQAHLLVCPRCARYYGELRTVEQSLRRMEQVALAITPQPALQERWMRAIEEMERPVAQTNLLRILDAWRGWQRSVGFASLTVIWVAILILKMTSPALPQRAESSVPLSDDAILLVLKAPAQDWPQWISQRRAFIPKPLPPRLPQPRSERPVLQFGERLTEPQLLFTLLVTLDHVLLPA